jgi:hypothetical protein
MDVALSEDDITGALAREGVSARIVEFAHLGRYKTAPELLAGGPVVLYLAVTPSFGHWACVFERAREVEVFDSAGTMVDQDLFTLDPETRRQLHETQPLLMELLLDPATNPLPVVINNRPLQQFAQHTQTCGRWVVWRLLHQSMSDEAFQASLDEAKRPGESYDQLVVRLTRPLVGK